MIRLSWDEGAPLPQARGGHATGVAGSGELIVAGGSRWPEPDRKERVRRVDAYDPARNVWRRAADLPVAMDGPAGGTVGGRLYLMGGYDGAKCRAEVLRGVGDGVTAWEPFAELPAARSLAAAAAVGDRLYLFGGTRTPDTFEECLPELLCVETTERRVRTCRPFPGRAVALAAAAATPDGRLLVVGGASRTADGKVVNSREAWLYAPSADRWEKLPDAPAALRGASMTSLLAADGNSHHLLLLGGFRDDAPAGGAAPGFTRQVWRFDAKAERWEAVAGEMPLAVGVTAFAPVEGGRRIVAAGGEDAPRSRTTRTLRARVAVG
ncbi:MAG TPA: kelch repeat-containing protein [Armatimonadaceae bacterium]|nr:kelch repeat-containing protein [Armatimonadaceae bacterium]